jgi:hydroxyethylthiazole kinase-like uncharacterized protein yjeF
MFIVCYCCKVNRIMNMERFDERWLNNLWRPTETTGKFNGGQVTIVGGSSLFHGAPILALKAASRCVGMVYLATPESDKGVAEQLKASLSSFIWIPREELGQYLAKSNAVLVGPGLMRNHNESDGIVCDNVGRLTREISLEVFEKCGKSKVVVDGGSLQVLEVEDIPKGTIITPNRKEYEMLFREKLSDETSEIVDQVSRKAKAFGLTILHKGRMSVVSDGERTITIEGGSMGMIKGGTGDVIAGLVVGLLAKNEPMLAVSVASYLTNSAAEGLEKERGTMFNADDLAERVAEVFGEYPNSDMTQHMR